MKKIIREAKSSAEFQYFVIIQLFIILIYYIYLYLFKFSEFLKYYSKYYINQRKYQEYCKSRQIQ
jgi:hypothetical protein